MNIAITGGSGFVGRFLIRHLLSCGCRVNVLTRKKRPPAEGICWILGDIGDHSVARNLVQSADAVVHAAIAGTGPFLSPVEDPIEYWQRNSTGSLRLLEEACRAGVSRFVFLSSGAVHDRVVGPLNEHHPLIPTTLYGAYKSSIETLIHHYGLSGRLAACSLRPTSVYGEADPIESSKWFKLTQDVLNAREVVARGGAKSVHASDVAKAVWLLLTAPENAVAGETFNCCDRMISDYEVASISQSITGSPVKIAGPEKVAKHEIDTTKIRSLGMRFGGTDLLYQTINRFVEHLKLAS